MHLIYFGAPPWESISYLPRWTNELTINMFELYFYSSSIFYFFCWQTSSWTCILKLHFVSIYIY